MPPWSGGDRSVADDAKEEPYRSAEVARRLLPEFSSVRKARLRPKGPGNPQDEDARRSAEEQRAARSLTPSPVDERASASSPASGHLRRLQARWEVGGRPGASLQKRAAVVSGQARALARSRRIVWLRHGAPVAVRNKVRAVRRRPHRRERRAITNFWPTKARRTSRGPHRFRSGRGCKRRRLRQGSAPKFEKNSPPSWGHGGASGAPKRECNGETGEK
jgi:hypothetical protein